MKTEYKNGDSKRRCWMCGVCLDQEYDYPTETSCWNCGKPQDSITEYNVARERDRQRNKEAKIGKDITEITKLYNSGVIDIQDYTNILTKYLTSKKE